MDGAKEYRNGDSMKLQLQTDSEALVALGAVDTALYAVGGRSHKPLDMSKVCQTFIMHPSPPTSLPPLCLPLSLPLPLPSLSSELKLWGLVLWSQSL